MLDETVLADPEELIAAGGPLLEVTASAGASIREALVHLDAGQLAAAVANGRPRALLVAGAGGSSAAGDLVSACAGRGSAVPVVASAGPSLPGWVGPLDLVVAVSASGESPETLALVGEAVRRGAAVVGVGFGGSLARHVTELRGIYLNAGREPAVPLARAQSWRLSVPVLRLAQELGIVDGGPQDLLAAADVLDDESHACGPQVAIGVNRAKDAAVMTAESLALVWGTPGIPAAASRRVARQFAENAGVPVLPGALPEVARTHARLLEGSWGGDDDIFRDRVSDPDAGPRPHLVLLDDAEQDDLSRGLAAALVQVAHDSGVPVTVAHGGEGHPLVRFARLVQVFDLASVYAALVLGADPAGTARGLHTALGSGGS